MARIDGALGFGERLLRFSFMGPDRRLIKVLCDVEIGPSPNQLLIKHLMEALQTLLTDMAPGTTVALLLTRPGTGGISRLDRQWTESLTVGATQFSVPLEPIFRANDEQPVQIGPAA
ncbi:hypothetical protein [Mycobacterium sp. 1274761.0]|uniref:hypothetical protein n=1 Tax=Mycobacterium sp. 1274761.0 TaxID=1834077 RepID=UPI001E5FB710|nr:hypothetical protein [Mycobacterium sp. 1274761.0]